MASIPPDIIYFAAIWVVSAFVLYLSTRLFGAKGGFIESLAASLLGAVVYTLFKGSLLFQIAALLLWLLILRVFFEVGWLRAFLIALVASIFSILASLILGVPLIIPS